MPSPASTFPAAQRSTPVTATSRGPERSCQRPPMMAPTPRKKMDNANAQVVAELDHPNAAMSGCVKRLHE